MFSMSSGLISDIERSTPSTWMRGEESVQVPLPRTNTVAASEPGSPEYWMVVTPESCPASTLLTLLTGVRRRSSLLTLDNAPVTETFFCVP